ncbi:MAG TPA: tail fiber domain-containing protein [Burkholderiaceae bacterium]
MGLQAGLANASNALQAAGLNQADRQFGASQGLQGQLANAQMQMQAQQMGQQDRQFGAQNRLAYDSLANAFNQRNSEFGGQLGLSYDQMGQADRQFGANYDYQQQRADMQDLMSLLGYGQQTDMYNNQLLGQDQQRAGSLFGLIPGLTPTQLDVTGPMNSYMGAQQAAYGRQGSAANGLFGALGQLGGAAIGAGGWGGLLSDIRAKTEISRVGTLDNGLPVYLYRYKDGGPMQIGVMAQDVQQVNPEAVIETDGGYLAVNYAEAVK